jgi:hypothetical protein
MMAQTDISLFRAHASDPDFHEDGVMGHRSKAEGHTPPAIGTVL